jgi:hypothetical protein
MNSAAVGLSLLAMFELASEREEVLLVLSDLFVYVRGNRSPGMNLRFEGTGWLI